MREEVGYRDVAASEKFSNLLVFSPVEFVVEILFPIVKENICMQHNC